MFEKSQKNTDISSDHLFLKYIWGVRANKVNYFKFLLLLLYLYNVFVCMQE